MYNLYAMKQVRLTSKQINIIKETAEEIFGKNSKVYIFGSRTDLSKKGGDIDILILTENLVDKFKKKLKFTAKLYKKLGEQKIDVIITDNPKNEIEETAVKTGVKI